MAPSGRSFSAVVALCAAMLAVCASSATSPTCSSQHGVVWTGAANVSAPLAAWSVGECCGLCAANSACAAFSLLSNATNSSTGGTAPYACVLYASGGSKQPSTGGVSVSSGTVGGAAGGLECGAAIAGTSYGDADLASLPCGSLAEGCGACAAVLDCAGVTYTNGSCGLKYSTGGKVAAAGSTSAALPARSGQRAPCTMDPGYDYLGNDVGNVTGVMSPDKCCGKCLENPECAAWTWANSSDGLCLLKSSGAGRNESTSAMVSGLTSRTVAPGVRVALSEKGVDFAMSIVIPLLENLLDGLPIPSFSFTYDLAGFNTVFDITDLTCNSVAVGSYSAQVNSDTGAITLHLQGVSASCNLNWHSREDDWPHISDSGSMDASSSGSSDLSLTVSLGAQDGAPAVGIGACNADISIDDLDIHGGGIVGFLGNLFKSLVKKGISGKAGPAICNEVHNMLPDEINKLLAGYQTHIPVPLPDPFDVAYASFALTSSPKAVTSALVVDIKGEIFNSALPVPAPFAPPTVGPVDAAAGGRMVELRLSTYFVASAAYVYQAAGLLNFTLTQTMLPAPDQSVLSIASVAAFAPGLNQLGLPATTPMTVGIAVARPANLSTDGNTLDALVPVEFSFDVAPGNVSAKPAFSVECPLEAGIAVDIAVTNASSPGEALVGNMTVLTCNLTLVSSAVGQVNVNGMRAITSILLDLVIPVLNKALAAGLPLPAIAGISLVNTQVDIGNGTVAVSSDLQINATRSSAVARHSD